MSKTEIQKSQKVPKEAFSFSSPAQFSFSDKEGEKKSLTIQPLYSGSPVTHWYWGKVIIDLDSMSFRKRTKFPVLRDHDTSKIVGYSGLPVISDDGGKKSIGLEDINVLDTPFAEEILKLGADGFPFEASISIRPTRIERLEEGTITKVNGLSVKGPIQIWRDCEYREGSVCVFGVDGNTSSKVFAESDMVEFSFMEVGELKQEEEKMPFDSKQFADDPEFQGFVNTVKAEASTAALKDKDAQVAEFSATIEKQKSEIQKLTDQQQDKDKRLSDLEKRLDLMAEKAIHASAAQIIDGKLSASGLEPRLQEKVKKYVGFSGFVKDGVLDAQGLSDALDKEIQEWKDTVGTVVLGGAGSMAPNPGTDTESLAVDKDADYLIKLMGGSDEDATQKPQ